MPDMLGQRSAPPTRPAPRSPLANQTRNASSSAPPLPQQLDAHTAFALKTLNSPIDGEALNEPMRPTPIRPTASSVSALSPRSPQYGGNSFVSSLISKFSAPSSPASFSSVSSPTAAAVPATSASLAGCVVEVRHSDEAVEDKCAAADVKHVHKRAPFNPHVHTMPSSAFQASSSHPPTATTTILDSSVVPSDVTQSSTRPTSSTSASSSPLPYPVPVLCTARSVTADWLIHEDQVLGSGFSSTVKLATSLHHHTPTAADTSSEPLQAACKIIDKRTANVDLVKFADECRVLSGVAHGNIVEMYGSYEDNTHVYVLTEVCHGGELFDVLCERGDKGMDEWEAAPLIAQLLDALAYLHGRGICHRDVKPENCLFLHPYHHADPSSSPTSASPHASPRSQSSIPTLKLTDFGFAANLLTKPRALRASSHLGSLGYTAPEIFSSSSYTESCDVWSVGAILHIMMTGLPPYTQLADDERKQPFWLYVNEMHWGERQGQVTIGGKAWDGRSDEVQALVRGMLELDVAKRLRASEALQSSWVKEGRERYRRANAAAEQTAGEVSGWSSQSVRERASSKATTQLTMREVMAEIVLRAGQTKEAGAAGGKGMEEEESKTSVEADGGAAGGIGEHVTDGVRPEKRTAAQRRLKALTMLDWKRG